MQGAESRIQGLESRGQGLESRVEGVESRVQDLGFRVQGLESRGQGLGFRVKRSGFQIRSVRDERLLVKPSPAVPKSSRHPSYKTYDIVFVTKYDKVPLGPHHDCHDFTTFNRSTNSFLHYDKVPWDHITTWTTSRLTQRLHDFHDFTTYNRYRNWIYGAKMSFQIEHKS